MLVTIRTYLGSTEANLDKGYLESNGIQSFLKSEMATLGDAFGGLGGQQIELQVKESEAEKAIQILDDK